MRKWVRVFFSIAMLLLLTGCSIVELRSSRLPETTVSELKSFYVVVNDVDPGKVYEQVRDAFTDMGFTATSGSKAQIPEGVDATVSYDDRWFWDLRNYLLELNIILRDPRTGYPIAEGESIRTSLASKSIKETSKEILNSIFNPAKESE